MNDRNEVRIENGLLTVVPRGWDKLWTLKRRVSIPLALVATVDVNRSPHRIQLGARRAGLNFMGRLAGYFYLNGIRQFWNYSGTGEVLAITVKPGGVFQEMYLSVKDAESTAAAIREAILLRAA